MLPAASAKYRRFPSCLTKAQASLDFTTRPAPRPCRDFAETRHQSSDIVIHRCRPRHLQAFNLSHSQNCSSISYLLYADDQGNNHEGRNPVSGLCLCCLDICRCRSRSCSSTAGSQTQLASQYEHVNSCAGASNGSSSRKLLNNACLGWATSYGQCGGTQCPSGSNQCSDSAYLCCPEDFSCQRVNEYFWSCFPEGSDINSVPTAAPAPAPSGAPAFAPGYAPSVARGSAPSGYARASLSPPAYGLSPASPTPTAYGSPSATPTAYGSPTATPIPSAPRQTPAAPQHTSPAEYAPPAEEDSPPSQWLSSDCEVVSNNADYPDGLQCSGKFPDPSCCSGDTCYTYSFWDSSKPHLAFAASEPHAGLGSCTGDYLIACCPAVVPE